MNGSRSRRSFHAILTALSLAAVCAALFSPTVRADSDIPPGTPPEIAAIMRKVQKGGRPTGSDIAKLQAWSQKLVEKVNGQVGNGSQYRRPTRTAPGGKAAAQAGEQEGIPCTVRVVANYSGRNENSSEEYQTTFNARAMLYPRLNGTGDYWATMMDPDAQVSSFRFEPLAAASGATIAKAGGGSYSMRSKDNKGNGSNSKGTFTQGVFSMLLVTTGKSDLLYPSGGGGGVAKGTTTTYDKDRSVTSDATGGGGALSVPFVSENVPLGPGKSTPIPKMTLSYRALVAAIRSGATATVTGNESVSNFSVSGMTYSAQSSISITLRPKPMEIIVEPVNERIYEAWEPMPDADDARASEPTPNTDAPASDFFPSPKPLEFHLVMHDSAKPSVAPGGNGLTRPNTLIGGQIDIHLHDVSEQKGVCMNFPASAASKKGLFFPKTQPAGIKWVSEQEVHTTSVTALEATVSVCARDTGAYGKLDAACETLGLECKNYKTTDNFLAIPLDDDDNNIADQWEKDSGIYDRRLTANWDDEDKPSGWQSNGDGLTLYEEYRGFIIDDPSHKEVFKRLDQKKRKLFVYLNGPDHEIYRQGAELFKNSSGMDVYYLHDPNRMKPMGPAMHPRWMNFNKTAYSDYDQAAVWIDDYDPKKPAYTKPMPGINELIPQCPVTTNAINVSRAGNTTEVEKWCTFFRAQTPPVQPGSAVRAACEATHVDYVAMSQTVDARKPTLIDQLMVFSVAHELGHSVGGRHHEVDLAAIFMRDHPVDKNADEATQEQQQGAIDAASAQFYSSGDRNCLMRYWHFDSDWAEFVLFYSGKWNLLTPAGGTQWSFCGEDLRNMHMKRQQ